MNAVNLLIVMLRMALETVIARKALLAMDSSVLEVSMTKDLQGCAANMA